MKIDRTNYEAYLIDYLDGNLSDEQWHSVDIFLQENEDIRHEFEGLEEINLNHEDVVFDLKDDLKRDFDNCEEANTEYCIGYLEGDLDPIEEIRFKSYLTSSEETRNKLSAFEKTKVIADLDIEYPNKNRLKKRTVSFYIGRSVAAAALFAGLFIGVNTLIKTEETPTIANLASVEVSEISGRIIDRIEIADYSAKLATRTMLAEKVKEETVVAEEAVLPEKENRNIVHWEPIKMRASSGIDMMKLNALALQQVDIKAIKVSEERIISLREYLAEEIQAKEKVKFSFRKIARTGLGIVSSLTGNKLKYDEDEAGRVVALSMDTKLLGFNLDLDKKKNN